MGLLLINTFFFARNRSNALSLLELKQTFLLLCNSTTYDRQIFEHFLLAADHNACVSRYRFESMVVIMAKIFSHIDPVHTVSTHQARPFFTASTSLIIDDCFAQCPGPVGLNKFQFYTLWRLAPSGLASFGHFSNVQALIGRLAEAKTIVHERRICVGCNASPIRGLCFRCIQCRKVVLCFECFGRGFAAGKHGLDHRMNEIYSNMVYFNSPIFYIYPKFNNLEFLRINLNPIDCDHFYRNYVNCLLGNPWPIVLLKMIPECIT